MGRGVGGAGWRCPHPALPCKPAGGGGRCKPGRRSRGAKEASWGVSRGFLKRVKGRVRCGGEREKERVRSEDLWKEEGVKREGEVRGAQD